MNRVWAGIAVSLISLSGASPVLAQQDAAAAKAEPTSNILETAAAAGTFKTLGAAIKAAGLEATLNGKGPFTVFAPTDEAFAKLPKGTVETLLKPENKDKLVAILTYHVVPGSVMSKSIKTGGVASVNGQRVDIKADKGVEVDGAKVTAADIVTTNGVIHVIDKVILPSEKNLVQTAVEAKTFGTLAKLLTSAGLVDALSGKDAFTVFAPTDEAFAKLPKETLEMLQKPENKDKLIGILKYHVVPGRVFSPAVAGSGWSAATLQGGSLTSKIADKKVLVGKATVTATDIDASNGVIHVIDTVLIPE
jgi:uncharacterized surface protein with fasciclin (FAS1) repeats